LIRVFFFSDYIEFVAVLKFKDDPTVKYYPYVFFLRKFQLVIEYQGRQHKVGWHNNLDDAKAIQARDELKRNFARSKGLAYLELDQSTKKELVDALGSFLRELANGLQIEMAVKPRVLSDVELKEIETPFKWNETSVKEAIGFCKTVKEFRQKYPTGYDYALKNDLWENLGKNLIRITHHGKYTKQFVADVASSCTTRNEFKTSNKGAWAAAQRNGWLEEVCSHMPKHIQRKNEN